MVKVVCHKSEHFLIDIKSFRSQYGPGVETNSNRNEYQEYFLGVKGGRSVRMTTYHYPVPLSRNMGTLTSWNPLGHFWACNGNVLPFLKCTAYVLRRIFGPRRDEVTGEWRRLHNEELNDMYASPNIVRVIKSRRMRWAGHVARMGEEWGVYRVLVGKPEGRRPPGRPRRRSVDTFRMDVQEVGCGYMDWIGLAQDRDRWRTFVSAVMNLGFP